MISERELHRSTTAEGSPVGHTAPGGNSVHDLRIARLLELPKLQIAYFPPSLFMDPRTSERKTNSSVFIASDQRRAMVLAKMWRNLKDIKMKFSPRKEIITLLNENLLR